MTSNPYPDGQAVRAAIKAAGTKARAADPAAPDRDRLRTAAFDRFLCRVFSEGERSQWVLKGGTGMLARVADARSTRDIDLLARASEIDSALADLERLASVDLGDHFRFAPMGAERLPAGEHQPYREGCRVTFEWSLGGDRPQTMKVDIVVESTVLSMVDEVEPANRLDLPRLESHPYRVYPVANHIADKVCATVGDYGGRPSSRERDLVDLVIFATTQRVGAGAMREAITNEARLRGLGEITRFEIPRSWGRPYETAAKGIPACACHTSIDEARTLMEQFVAPCLAGAPIEITGTWDPVTLSWSSGSPLL